MTTSNNELTTTTSIVSIEKRVMPLHIYYGPGVAPMCGPAGDFWTKPRKKIDDTEKT